MVTKEEAKSIVAYAFRNTRLEDVHAGDAELDDETMKKLMKEAVNKVYFLLELRDKTRNGFRDLAKLIHEFYGLEEWDDPEIESVYGEWEILLEKMHDSKSSRKTG
ncbi:hypothetical protein AKJ38_02285 [candidate division MSBL1 archaeon SCGC-AAA259I14]|uniref:Uncharacterized protein n=1 Tax=candidate division MSBL1 archaeon SCGC-AAA259I14 TaxID=1698268 RepID=A0A133URX6_9EURY|nr:hypothetical protein AKJ38_02285 [candidate division MSBL1 archaeon SCGC-AAA259I14]